MGEVATSGDPKEHRGQSSLFLLRLWWPEGETPESRPVDEQEGASAMMHGRLLHVTGSGASNFESWPALVELLQQMLPHP
ncbi:MAG TPA: hypothetical protein VJ183_06275 [Chloroflexia bacterium]|nr:hypothetical protein [Chloroflexia bacterium]